MSGAANCGYCRATCLKPSSASVAFPARMYFTARSKSARAAGGTSGRAASAGAPLRADGCALAAGVAVLALGGGGTTTGAGFTLAGAAAGRFACELQRGEQRQSQRAGGRPRRGAYSRLATTSWVISVLP